MVHKRLCLSCGGFDLVDVRCVQILVSLVILLSSTVPLPFNLQCRLFDGDFFPERGVFNLSGSCPSCKLYPYYCFVSHLTSILHGVTSSFITIGGYPFIRRTTTRRTTHVLKHSGYWCYPGVESRTFMGAWAGRCVIAHLDDCWGPFRRSQASSHRTWHR